MATTEKTTTRRPASNTNRAGAASASRVKRRRRLPTATKRQMVGALAEHPWELEWMPAFLVDYIDSFNLTMSAAAVGLSARAVQQAAKNYEDTFGRALLAIRRANVERIEATLFESALAGDTVAGFFLLKNNDPERYSDRLELRGQVSVDHSLTVTGGREPRELDAATRHEAARLLLEGATPADLGVVEGSAVDD